MALQRDVLADVCGPLHLAAEVASYLYTAAAEQSTSGLPTLRPLILHYPAETASRDLDDQWLLGPNLLVAPAKMNETTGKADLLEREIHFPGKETRWYSWWNTSKAPIVGPKTVARVHTAVEHAPIFVRGGSVVPMLSTAASPASSAASLALVVAMSKSSESASAAGSLYVDDGVTPQPSEAVINAYAAVEGGGSAAEGGGYATASASTMIATFAAAERTLTSSPKFSGANRKGKSSPTKYAFPTVVDEVTILGVSVGITEVLLTVYGSDGRPVGKPKVIAKSDYAWDGSRLVVKRLAQDLKVKFSLEWTI